MSRIIIIRLVSIVNWWGDKVPLPNMIYWTCKLNVCDQYTNEKSYGTTFKIAEVRSQSHTVSLARSACIWMSFRSRQRVEVNYKWPVVRYLYTRRVLKPYVNPSNACTTNIRGTITILVDVLDPDFTNYILGHCFCDFSLGIDKFERICFWSYNIIYSKWLTRSRKIWQHFYKLINDYQIPLLMPAYNKLTTGYWDILTKY